MAGEFTNLKIKKVAIHKVFKREDKSIMIPPVFNNQCSELDSEAKRALVNRITRAFGNDSHSIKMNISDTGDNSAYKYITDFWMTDQNDNEFLELSKNLTLLMAGAQKNRLFSDSILVTVKGTAKGIEADFIAVIKAEIQDGFNIIENNGEQLLTYINTLLMTRQQKLHKIGFFINNQVRGRQIEVKDVSTFLFDSNTGDSVSDSKAEYFYKTFLGLTFRQDADVITNKFYVASKKFINESNMSALERIRLQTALHDYLRVRKELYINPSQFANEYIDNNEMKDAYLKSIENAGIPGINTRKDTSMIKDQKVRRLAFENSVKITVPIEEFDDTITIEENKDGDTIVTIKGKYVNE